MISKSDIEDPAAAAPLLERIQQRGEDLKQANESLQATRETIARKQEEMRASAAAMATRQQAQSRYTS